MRPQLVRHRHAEILIVAASWLLHLHNHCPSGSRDDFTELHTTSDLGMTRTQKFSASRDGSINAPGCAAVGLLRTTRLVGVEARSVLDLVLARRIGFRQAV
ncbi:MAG: hypothetical protein DMG00_26475 [Acidobacteria bacterium]|nr:MAG: hypothetical protein DMG00_26475 [Acidobacteriota bacterium]